MPSGNHLGPRGRCSLTIARNVSTLNPSLADTTKLSSKRVRRDALSSWDATISGPAMSALVTTSSLKGAAEASTRPATHSSPLPTGFVASMRSATTSMSASSASAALLSSLPRASLGLCRPGVSTITSCDVSVFTMALMRLRVVWATSEVMAILAP